jgi:hypothetical protein
VVIVRRGEKPRNINGKFGIATAIATGRAILGILLPSRLVLNQIDQGDERERGPLPIVPARL